jgi:hypothetical protein
MNITKNLGMLLLAIWLIATGLLAFVANLNAAGIFNLSTILSALALVAGILILIGR